MQSNFQTLIVQFCHIAVFEAPLGQTRDIVTSQGFSKYWTSSRKRFVTIREETMSTDNYLRTSSNNKIVSTCQN